MILWNDLGNTDILLYRTPAIHNEYKLFLSKTNSIKDHIINKVIGNKKEDLYLTINKYPYDTEEDVIHLIIWDLSNNNYNNDEQKLKYQLFAEKFFNPNYFDMIVRINKVEHRSIPDLKHCHLFLRLKDQL